LIRPHLRCGGWLRNGSQGREPAKERPEVFGETPEEYIMNLNNASNQELVTRASRAYFTASKKKGCSAPDQPSSSSDVTEIAGKRYVVLNNVNGILAVYGLKNDGVLKRLEHWPESLR
jgi:hypothetical protein